MTPRDGGGTQNRQKSTTDGAARAESSGLELCRVVTEENEVKYDCRQKKKMQTSAKSINGSRFWDGSDFLAWGTGAYKDPKGIERVAHPKFFSYP